MVFRCRKSLSAIADQRTFGRTHRLYLCAAVLATAGYAMTAGIISGDPGELLRLIEAYLNELRILIIAVVGSALYSRFKED
jgi:hypothetical protein